MLLKALLFGAAWLYWLLPLGWPRLEQPLACLLSWPMAWPFLTYSRLHRLHHRWNASDARDPERTTPLPQELAAAGPWQRLLQRHPLPVRLLLLGGVGLIADTARKGRRLQAVDRALARACQRDGAVPPPSDQVGFLQRSRRPDSPGQEIQARSRLLSRVNLC